jgi:predicted MFS family arabinose efflux permease
VIVAAAGGVLFLMMGLRQGFGLFLRPLGDDVGITRETFGFGLAMMNLVWGFAALPAGILADRHGSAPVATGGGALYLAGLVMLALTQGPASYIAGNVLVGAGMSAAGFTVVMAAVGKATAIEERTRALALAGVGSSIGQFVMVPATHGMIEAWGWSMAYGGLALTSLLFFVCVLGIRGIRAAPVADRDRQSMREALLEAAGVRSYWLLTAGFFVCGFQLAFIHAHFPAWIADQGLAPGLGATALAIIGFFNIVGTLVSGRIAERTSKKLVLGWLYAIRGMMVLMLLFLPASPALVIAFSIGMGLTWLSTVPLTGNLVAIFFGPRYMATLYGVVFLSHQIGGFVASWGGGRVFDLTGSYALVWWTAAGLCVAAAALHWAIDERPVARLAGARA